MYLTTTTSQAPSNHKVIGRGGPLVPDIIGIDLLLLDWGRPGREPKCGSVGSAGVCSEQRHINILTVDTVAYTS